MCVFRPLVVPMGTCFVCILHTGEDANTNNAPGFMLLDLHLICTKANSTFKHIVFIERHVQKGFAICCSEKGDVLSISVSKNSRIHSVHFSQVVCNNHMLWTGPLV